MSRRGSFNGGSTLVYPRSSWFSRSQPDADPSTGMTFEEKVSRFVEEYNRSRETITKRWRKTNKLRSLNTSKTLSLINEQKRLEEFARMRARLAEQDIDPSITPRKSDAQQKERMSKIVVEMKRKKKIIRKNPLHNSDT